MITHIPSRSPLMTRANRQTDPSEMVLLELEMGISPTIEPDPMWVLVSKHITAVHPEVHLALTVQEQHLAGSTVSQTIPAVSAILSDFIAATYVPYRRGSQTVLKYS